MKFWTESRLLLISMILLLVPSNTWNLLTPEKVPDKKNCSQALDVSSTASAQNDRKLVTEATPSNDGQLTNPNQGSEMNKIDISSHDDYDKMDLIVNDIKQVNYLFFITL